MATETRARVNAWLDHKTATAIATSGSSTGAILSDGGLKCWGSNLSGQLGQGDTEPRGDAPNDMGDNLLAVDLGSGRTATAVAMGLGSTCAILDNDALKCWGNNDSGQLGLGDIDHRGEVPGQMGDALPTTKLFSALW